MTKNTTTPNTTTPKEIFLDFCSKDITSISCAQYDKDSRKIIIHLLDNGRIFRLDPEIHSLLFKMTKKDNKKILDATIINSDGSASYVLTEQACMYHGVYDIQFMLVNASDKSILHTMPCKLVVARSAADNTEIESSDEFNALNKILAENRSIQKELINTKQEAEDLIENIDSRISENEQDILNEAVRAAQAESVLNRAITSNKPVWDDKYTKNEVDNKFSALESNIDWKESVDTFDDIAAAYPDARDGWTVNVKDTDYTYRYNGSVWVAISANAIPKATSSVDGLLSKEDKTKLDDTNIKKHTHSNKSVLDGITAEDILTWNSTPTAADIGALPVSGITANDGRTYNIKKLYTIDLTSYSSSDFYFVRFSVTCNEIDCEIHSTSGGSELPYNQNILHFLLTSQGWSDTPRRFIVLNHAVFDSSEITIASVVRGTTNGENGFYIRGGLTYTIYSNTPVSLCLTDYVSGSQSGRQRFPSGTPTCYKTGFERVTLLMDFTTNTHRGNFVYFDTTIKSPDFDGLAQKAVSASNDSEGRNIKDTYAVKSDTFTAYRGTLTGDANWNACLSAGSYNVNYCNMTEANNAPAGEYNYGVLEVIPATSTRLVQIYYPHMGNTAKYDMWMRFLNGSVWDTWRGVYSTSHAPSAEDIGALPADKNVKIYNNLDVYAKDTISDPILKVRSNRVDILKTDADSKSVGVFSKEKIDINTLKLRLHSADTILYGNNSKLCLDDPNMVRLDLSGNSSGQGHFKISGGHIIDGSALFLLGKQLTSMTADDTLVGFCGANSSTAYCGITDKTASLQTGAFATQEISSGLVVKGYASYGEAHLYANSVKIGVKNTILPSSDYAIEINHTGAGSDGYLTKLRAGYGTYIELDPCSSTSANGKEGVIRLNGNTVINDDGAVIKWSSKTLQVQKDVITNNTLQDILAALIRKTGLTQNDI